MTGDEALARDSWYAATAPRAAPRAGLDGEAGCEVAIVGGGLAGLSAALELAQRGLEVRVLEARYVGFGASGRNGGQAIHGFACDPGVLEAQLGREPARQAWELSVAALDLLRERIRSHAIDCQWRDGQISVATTPSKARALMQWADRIESTYDYPLARLDAGTVRRWIDSPRFHGGVYDARSGHLHPLRYTQGLARAAERAGALIHEDTRVVALRHGAPVELRTARGTLRARQVLLAGNVYARGLVPALDARIMPVGTYLACSARLSPALAASLIPSRAAVCDTDVVLDYFRLTDDDRMLYGGGVSYSTATPRKLAERLRRRMVRSFPQLSAVPIEHAWGGFVDITMNRAPDFGRLEPDGAGAANIYYLQGFSGHGLALTGIAGKLVAEAMSTDASRFDVFSKLTHRAFPGGRWLRMPALVLGMAWYRMRDLLG